MARTNPRQLGRQKRKKRIRKKISGTAQRPRLSVFRSARHIYAQVIDDIQGQTLASASTLEEIPTGDEESSNKIAKAAYVGKKVAERAQEKGVSSVIFDRNGFLYHGRVKAVSDGAREAGLKF
jgi:large subunit ribosomal protein L18